MRRIKISLQDFVLKRQGGLMRKGGGGGGGIFAGHYGIQLYRLSEPMVQS